MNAQTNIHADLAEELPIERIALDDANGDLPTAVNLLTARILAHPEIVKQHLPEWARAWAHAKVHGLIAARRQTILRSVGKSSQFSTALAGAMSNEMQRLMETPIFGGKRLADATPAEVRESAARYQALADNNAQMARWQRLVADAAAEKDAETIGAALTEATLARLWSEADA